MTSEQDTTESRSAPLSTGASPASGEPTDPAQRHAMIAEAAFFTAQARGFTPSRELDDWLAAEREIEQRLANPTL
jgi:Protein of unknown function (DUF2934)